MATNTGFGVGELAGYRENRVSNATADALPLITILGGFRRDSHCFHISNV